MYKIFAINPGSTSTKIALFQGENVLFKKNIIHSAQDLSQFNEISQQLDYRRALIEQEVAQAGFSLEDCDAYVGRGGGLVNIPGGTYPINEILLHHAQIGFTVKHPATLGPQLAYHFAQCYGGQAFTVNPPDVDEFCDLARMTGIRGIYRESRVHALNQKEVGIRYAAEKGVPYQSMNLIICHIGGGISVTAHCQGKMIDSNDIAQGDGPMAPTRCGALPVRKVIQMCFSGAYTQKQLNDMTSKEGGMVSHLGTSDVLEVKQRITQGDTYAKLVYDSMIYQIAKASGSMAAVLSGQVDGIILTGGIAHDEYLVTQLKAKLDFIAPITVMPGEFEMEALATGAMRVLTGVEQPKEYTGIPCWSGFGNEEG